MNDDTVKLLKECDSGVQMGVSAIEEVVEDVKNEQLRSVLNACKAEHERLRDEVQDALFACGETDHSPNPLAQGMSWLKTNAKMAMDRSDATVADLMTDGCNMGMKSLHRYLNEYSSADEQAKAYARRLISLEERLSEDMRSYL